jgi:uncharacterized membrane protein YqhA
MLEKTLYLRFIYMLAVIITFVNSLFFLFNGTLRAYNGYLEVLYARTGTRPAIFFVESLDAFMIAWVLLIFSLGMMRIFIQYNTPGDRLPVWLRLGSFKELKVLLWETILLTLVIMSVSEVVRKIENITWNQTILPVIILALSASLYIMRKEEDRKGGDKAEV